jgi:hypothetical protein
MKVGILGSGGREHAICSALKKSNKISKIYCIPGNGGTQSIAENINIDVNDFKSLLSFIISENIELIIVGPEKPLVDGVVDFLENHKIKVFGPNKITSKLEGSKIFTKKLCEKYKIPTAKFGVLESEAEAKEFLKKCKFPTVVKADGLASGKGVYICENLEDSISSVKEIFGGKFGDAKKILIEEFLQGEEMSFFIISDGETYKKFGTAQDHKRVQEGDKGKNTGGMGAYSPSRLDNKILEEKIMLKNDTFVHRDFHISNIIPCKNSYGILDSQDAVIGNKAYDLASLIDDVRFQTSRKLKAKLLSYYIDINKNKINKIEFENDFYILSVLRNLKIIGIFTRLSLRDQKNQYLKLIPYAWKLIESRIKNKPVFKDLKLFLNKNFSDKLRKKYAN